MAKSGPRRFIATGCPENIASHSNIERDYLSLSLGPYKDELEVNPVQTIGSGQYFLSSVK